MICMILQLIFTINHGKASMERGFNLNKLPLAQNVEELIIRSQRLIKDHLLSHKLSPHSKDISSRMLEHVKCAKYRCENQLQHFRDQKQQNEKDKQKSVVESEIKFFEELIQNIQKISERIFHLYLQRTLLTERSKEGRHE